MTWLAANQLLSLKMCRHTESGGPLDRSCGNLSECEAEDSTIVHLIQSNTMVLLDPDSGSRFRTDIGQQ
jgi:hypothetical protein